VDVTEQAFIYEVARRIETARKLRRMGKGLLAATISVHRNTLGRYLKGDQAIPLFYLLQIAEALNVYPWALVPEVNRASYRKGAASSDGGVRRIPDVVSAAG
jgi:transcriptional regulator with XRE-family HTH domain